MKDERIYLRTSVKNKRFLQALADDKFKGNMNALFDKLIEELKEDYDFEGGDWDD